MLRQLCETDAEDLSSCSFIYIHRKKIGHVSTYPLFRSQPFPGQVILGQGKFELVDVFSRVRVRSSRFECDLWSEGAGNGLYTLHTDQSPTPNREHREQTPTAQALSVVIPASHLSASYVRMLFHIRELVLYLPSSPHARSSMTNSLHTFLDDV